MTSSSSSKIETSCIQPKRFMSHIFYLSGVGFTNFPYFRAHTLQNGRGRGRGLEAIG